MLTTNTSPAQKEQLNNNNNNDSTIVPEGGVGELISRPCVFQCLTCRSIVSDSSDLECVLHEHKLIVFRTHHPNVDVLANWHWSQETYSFGSLYQDLACAKCGTVIGVQYKTTNAEMDKLRDKYALYSGKLSLYELRFDQNELVERIKAQVQEAYLGPRLVESSHNNDSHIQYLTGEVDKLKKVLTHLIQENSQNSQNSNSNRKTIVEPMADQSSNNGINISASTLSPHTPDAPKRRGRPPGSVKKTPIQ